MSWKDFARSFKRKSALFDQTLKTCQELLQSHPIAKETREYLSSRVSPENQERFEFGYFPKDEELPILFEKVSQKAVFKTGLAYPYHVQDGNLRVFTVRGGLRHHNLITPYRDLYGNIVALVGRTILSEEDRTKLNIQKYKYTTPFSKSLHLFGINQAWQSILEQGFVIIVEGQIDCVTCHEFGTHNVVALGGTAFSDRQFDLLLQLTDKIYLLLDNDTEGHRAQDKIIKRYSELARINKLTLPVGFKDVDQCLRIHRDPSAIFHSIDRRENARSHQES